MTENDQDDGFEPPTDHLTITTDPYLGVERRENALAIRREGREVVIEETNVAALVAALETLSEQAYRPGPTPLSQFETEMRTVNTADEAPLGDEDADADRECSECGADVVEALGGTRCSVCDWTDSEGTRHE